MTKMLHSRIARRVWWRSRPLAAGGGPPERQRFALLPLLWLGFLAWPISDIVTGRTPGSDLVAAAALVAFVGLYASMVWLEYASPRGARRLRVELLAVMAALALVLVAAYGSNWQFALMYLSAGCVMALRPRQALVAVAVVAATMLAACLDDRVDAPTTVVFVFVTVLVGVTVVGTRRVLALVAELHATRGEVARLAVGEERLRFARDLHDLLGHSLSLIVVKSQLARRLADRDPQAAAAEVREIEMVARRSLVEVREAVSGYRGQSLAAELDGARAALQAAGLDIVVRTSGSPLPEATEALLGWVVREGATNVLRHSRARRCEIEVRAGGGRVDVQVRDDGRGPVGWLGRDGAAGSGLRGLAERVAAVGGRLDAGPQAGGGFRLAASLPLPPATPEPASRPERAPERPP